MTVVSNKRFAGGVWLATVMLLATEGAVGAAITGDMRLLWLGLLGAATGFFGIAWMVHLLSRGLDLFADSLSETVTQMIKGEAPSDLSMEETLVARLNHSLQRLYGIMEDNRRAIERERVSLQSLVSDVAHQVKTPVSNLKLLIDTLLTKDIDSVKRDDLLKQLRGQVEKLDFLFAAMVKTSRLETGVIQLRKQEAVLYATLAQAMGSIVYAAEKKNLSVSVDCPETLVFAHDPKWTAEALFNVLDNAVKYTSKDGQIAVRVEAWESFVKIDVADNGKGIAEGNQASVFKRFYREPEVSEVPGVGLGLYLTREIVRRQGGYIKVRSAPGEGAVFSIFLPYQ